MLYRALYHSLIALGRPFGGVHPRRLYDALGRRAYPRSTENFTWTRNRWGHELLLSHHFHLDRNILIYGDYDHNLHLLFQSRIRPGMTILDVGANLGEMTLHLASLTGPKGTVHAFEPFPPAFNRLVAHIRRNQLEAIAHPWPIALSNAPAQLTMSVPAADADNQGVGSIVNHDKGRLPGTITVEALTLDAFAREHAIEKIDFVKLDIQGAEYAFLEGAKETLRRDMPELVMEISPEDLRGVGKNSRDLLLLVESLGYAVFSVRQGRIAKQIHATEIPLDFAATNVLCVPTTLTRSSRR